MKTSSTTILGILVISSFGIWGCAQQSSSALQHKMNELEARHATLENEYRNVVASNESNRRKLVGLESQRTELVQQVEDLKVVVQERDELKKKLVQKVEDLKVVAQERDELKQNLTQRTKERDSEHAKLVDFGSELQNLVGRVQSAASVNFDNGNVTSSMTVSRRGN